MEHIVTVILDQARLMHPKEQRELLTGLLDMVPESVMEESIRKTKPDTYDMIQKYA